MLVEGTILSSFKGKVRWELNALLAADKRAKEFTRSQVAGELEKRATGFQVQEWARVEDKVSDRIADSDVKGDTVSREVKVEDGIDEIAEIQPLERNFDQELKDAYDKGFEAGRVLTSEEAQSTQEGIEKLISNIKKEVRDLPAIWPVATDLSLEIATMICEWELGADQEKYIGLISRVFQAIDLPSNIPVELCLSEDVKDFINGEALDGLVSDKAVNLKFDSGLGYFDVRVAYDNVTIERYLHQDIDQLRDQLIAQFPSSIA